MTESYGAQAIPIASAPGTPVTVSVDASDPLLSYLGSYLKTACNARLGAAFGAIANPGKVPLASSPPIAYVFAHDPEQWEFTQTLLPALFLFRNADGGGAPEDVASDWTLTTESISVLWVLPSATQDRSHDRVRFASKLFHLITSLIDLNRDPSWVVSGDTDTTAATEGSSLATYCRFHRLRVMTQAKRKPLAIAIDGAKSMVFPAYEAQLEVRERFNRDATRDDLLDGLDVLIATPTAAADDGLVLEDFTLDT